MNDNRRGRVAARRLRDIPAQKGRFSRFTVARQEISQLKCYGHWGSRLKHTNLQSYD